MREPPPGVILQGMHGTVVVPVGERDALHGVADGPNSLAEISNALMRAVGELNSEILGFTKQRIDAGVAVSHSLAQCKSVQAAIEVQMNFARAEAQVYLNEARKIMELASNAAIGGFKPSHENVAITGARPIDSFVDDAKKIVDLAGQIASEGLRPLLVITNEVPGPSLVATQKLEEVRKIMELAVQEVGAHKTPIQEAFSGPSESKMTDASAPLAPTSAATITSSGFDAARIRGELTAAEILRQPEMLKADEFADLLHMSRQAVHQKRAKGEVLALQGATRDFYFPAWQINRNGQVYLEIRQLLDIFDRQPWVVYRFLMQSHPEFEGITGLEALRRGRSRYLLAVATSLGSGSFA